MIKRLQRKWMWTLVDMVDGVDDTCRIVCSSSFSLQYVSHF